MGSAIAPRRIRRAIAEQKLAPPLGLAGDASALTVHCYHCSNRTKPNGHAPWRKP